MNQIIKDVVYGKGNRQQVEFLSRIGGMNDEETEVLHMLHDGRTELYIQEDMSLDRKAYKRVEESVRAKLLLAIFECINFHMDREKQYD